MFEIKTIYITKKNTIKSNKLKIELQKGGKGYYNSILGTLQR